MLDRSDILELWSVGGEMREVAATEIVGNFDYFSKLFFDLMQTDDARVLAVQALNRFPFLRKGFGLPSQGVPPGEAYGTFEYCHRRQVRFMEELAYYMSEMDACGRQSLAGALLRYFPGIAADLPESLRCEPGGDEARLRQLMVFVTGHCNLQCPYCFSHDIVHTEISLADLRRIFEWASREGVKSITPCGGEPLLYANFCQFLQMAVDVGMTTYFATNFTIDCSQLQHFTADVVRGIFVHVTGAATGVGRLKRVVERNIALAKERCIEMVGRVNIASVNFKDVRPLLDYVAQAGLRRVHVSLSIPSVRATNEYVGTAAFEAFVPVISEVVRYMAGKGIALGFAKPLPLCLFPDDMADVLLQWGYGTAACDIAVDGYMHNVALSPALDFSPCLGLQGLKIPFTPEITWGDLSRRFAGYAAPLQARPLYERCNGCYLWHRRLCQGSCLSYKE